MNLGPKIEEPRTKMILKSPRLWQPSVVEKLVPFVLLPYSSPANLLRFPSPAGAIETRHFETGERPNSLRYLCIYLDWAGDFSEFPARRVRSSVSRD